MNAGDKVRLIANPSKVGVLGNETDGPEHRLKVLVHFLDGDGQFVLKGSLELVENKPLGPFAMIQSGRYGHVSDLRGLMTFYRLSGRLANLIYSLNTTNTQFFAYQFKPVVHFLSSPCNGILIADEVGLGKTIEAGLIWTELRAREEAKRLLVICPAMLREKWQFELSDRFGVKADIVDANELLKRLESLKDKPHEPFALISSMQGLRPSKAWDYDENPAQTASAKLARYLNDTEFGEAIVDLTIIDEAHYLRNRETQTYKLGSLLRPVTQNLVMLSATPIQLKSSDLFNLLHLLDEDAFPYEYSFERTLKANGPIVELRDKVLNSIIDQSQFIEQLHIALLSRFFDDNEQIEFLIENPPTDVFLASPIGRAEIADRLDRINPLAKVVTRTLKRDVQEFRVQRMPVAIKIEMNQIERDFYEAITEEVRNYCDDLDSPTGFMLTIPQREMSSCIAAACRSWAERLDPIEQSHEILFENYGSTEIEQHHAPKIGPLLQKLIAASNAIGNYSTLYKVDSKYSAFISNLKKYWDENQGKKVVLFSFYRKTLRYLEERLKLEGITSVVVYGGMDKQEALARFKDVNGPNILLSSEVASEGVDLQFSSLIINYDLPWNPMRIEQRIGRIDRIGQESDKILIWNFVYKDTIDERVYDRLLERLNIFKQALGSLEAILGDEITQLGRELLTHKLSPEQELARIDRACVAIETVNLQQEALEVEATQLIAHGDFIQNQVSAAKELGRYITGENLFAYVNDFLTREYPGTRFKTSDENMLEAKIDLSIECKSQFSDFLAENRMHGITRLLSNNPPAMLFENKLGKTTSGIERVTQEHPLVRFVAAKIKSSATGNGYFPVSAIEVSTSLLPDLPVGDYIYAVARWSISGSRDIERLEYVIFEKNKNEPIFGDQAERLVNIAAMNGNDWLAAQVAIAHEKTAELFDLCKLKLEERFKVYSDDCLREDRDRIKMMLNLLQHRLEDRTLKAEEKIHAIESNGTEKQKRILPAMKKKMLNEMNSIQAKMEKLRLKEKAELSESFVSGGIIHLV